MQRNRSGRSVIQSPIDIKRWQQRPPSVAEARPARCPVCATASCPVGGPIQLQGHGARARLVCGPTAPDAPPVLLVVTARRYRCVPCGAVLLVVPHEVLGRRRYSASAIGFALALWGLALATAAEVRRQVCPARILGADAIRGWVTLRRWARAVAQRHLFPSTPDSGPSVPLRGVAQRVATALAASADPTTRSLALAHRAFLGAAHAA